MAWDGLPPTISAAAPTSGGDRLRLLVINDEGVTYYPLPEQGTITVGRAEECEIRVDDPAISREHVRVHVDGSLRVEDLGSQNGTFLHGERLRGPQPLANGHVLEVGGTMIVVQRERAHQRSPRLVGHGHFEVRLAEACADARPGPFAVVRLSVEGSGMVKTALTRILRPTDLLAGYAPGEYELLLLDTARKRAEALTRDVVEALSASGMTARVGIATYPADATTADGLIDAANAALTDRRPHGDLIVEDKAMQDLYRLIDRIAQGTISVLLLGETGVGKEVIAEQTHKRSPRAERPFVRLNCAALSETVVESELFGHEKGAFTGADQAKVGLLESAEGGSVFLDEVGDLPLGTQAKLLRALEQREVLPVGGLRPRPIDVRFIAATNRDLEAEVGAGRFREDLFYRLNGVSLSIPPLRERTREIEPLAETFLDRVSRSMGLTQPPMLSDRALQLLTQYAWPGNIRELKNVIERAVLLCDQPEIQPEHLPVDKLSASWAPARPASRAGGGDAHKQQIIDALEQCAGNQTRAARILGISRRTLTKWLDRYDVPRPRKR